jgi:hypothetical protein
MFKTIDEDGGGTLSLQEIWSLFRQNGIMMSTDEVAALFKNAQRQHLIHKKLRQEQTGVRDKTSDLALGRLGNTQNQEQFKICTQSPPALLGKLRLNLCWM